MEMKFEICLLKIDVLKNETKEIKESTCKKKN